MDVPEWPDDTRFVIFRNDERQLRVEGVYATISMTQVRVPDDFKSHRGVHIDVRMDDLRDARAELGRETVAQEIGSMVFALLDTALKEENDGEART